MNLPNSITIIRIILALIIPYFIYTGQYPMAITFFVIASLSDKIDGIIARKYNLITDFGKFMDPLADKILIYGTFVSIILLLNKWMLLYLIPILIRDVQITYQRLNKKVKLAAKKYGKIKMVVQVLTAMILFANLYYSIIVLSHVMLIISMCMSIYSGLKTKSKPL